jgi:hypothetical protein
MLHTVVLLSLSANSQSSYEHRRQRAYEVDDCRGRSHRLESGGLHLAPPTKRQPRRRTGTVVAAGAEFNPTIDEAEFQPVDEAAVAALLAEIAQARARPFAVAMTRSAMTSPHPRGRPGGGESPEDKRGGASGSAQGRQKAIDEGRAYISAANTNLPQQSLVESGRLCPAGRNRKRNRRGETASTNASMATRGSSPPMRISTRPIFN